MTKQGTSAEAVHSKRMCHARKKPGIADHRVDPPRCGLASTLHGTTRDERPPVPRAGRLLEYSGRELAEWLRSSSTLEAGIGMAAFNALLEVRQIRIEEIDQHHVGYGRTLIGISEFCSEVADSACCGGLMYDVAQFGNVLAGPRVA